MLDVAKEIEIYFSSNCRKGTYIFLVIVMVRHKVNKKLYYLEIKLGKTNKDKDEIENIKILLGK